MITSKFRTCLLLNKYIRSNCCSNLHSLILSHCSNSKGNLNTLPEYMCTTVNNSVCKYSTTSQSVSNLPISDKLEESLEERDIFGLLGQNKHRIKEQVEEEEEEEEEEEFIPVVPQKLKPTSGQYAQMIKTYISRGDLNSAHNVLILIKKNGDRPIQYHYNLLLNGFAYQGNLPVCFDLFKKMRRKEMKIKPNTIVSLFNSIACSDDNLKAKRYFEKLNKYIKENNYPLTQPIYNVMIKAYGRHHMIEEAYKLCDTMLENNLKIGITTINSLMYASITDRDSGLKYVIRTWQLMKKFFIPPDLMTFNLVLRAIRDTKFGECTPQDLLGPGESSDSIIVDENRPNLLSYPPIISVLPVMNTTQKLLEPIEKETKNRKFRYRKKFKKPLLESSGATNQNAVVPVKPHQLNLDAILEKNKLILFGGFNSFMDLMENSDIDPDVKTFTYMMELVPDSCTAEKIVIQRAVKHKLRLDIDFFNMLIKKRCLRNDKAAAKVVMDDIQMHNLKPNIMTYGVLAMSCNGAHDGRELIDTMSHIGLSLNKYIVDSLLNDAFKRVNFMYVLELMELTLKDRIRLDESTFKKFDEFQSKMTQLVKTKHYCTGREKFKKGFEKFNLRYSTWTQQMGRQWIDRRKVNK